MSLVSYTVCDVCHTPEVRSLLPHFRKIAVSDRTADICSVECAQVWIAYEFESSRSARPENALPVYNRKNDT